MKYQSYKNPVKEVREMRDPSSEKDFKETISKLKALEIKLEKEISEKNLPESTELVSQLLRVYELKRKYAVSLD